MFSPSVLGLDVGHALQLSKILSMFIKINVSRFFSSSASFLGRDLIISVFVSSCMDSKGLKKFVNKQEELLGVQGILCEWKAKSSFVCTEEDSCFLRGSNLFWLFYVCSFRRSRSSKNSTTLCLFVKAFMFLLFLLFVHKRTCASFVVQTSSDSSLSVPLGDLDHLKILQRSFVITYMDKCCNNVVFVCKKFYVSSVFSELNSPVGACAVSNLAQSDILKFHLSFNKLIILKVLSVALVSCFFVQFGSFIKIQLNLDLSVQPALVL